MNRPLNKRLCNCMTYITYFIFMSVLFDMQGIYENFYFINIKMDSESLCVFPKVAELLSNSVFTRAQPFLARVIFTMLFSFINDIYYLLNIQNVSGTV